MLWLTLIGLTICSLATAKALPTNTDSISARSPDANGLQPPSKVIFHDVTGAEVSSRPLTANETKLWEAEQADPKTSVERRDANDILFLYEYHAGIVDTGSDTYYYWTSRIVADTEYDYDPCAYQTFYDRGWTDSNFCHQSNTINGQWYYIDNCDSGPDWDTQTGAPPGSYVAKLRTWNDAYVGDCWAASHTVRRAQCLGSSVETQRVSTTLMKCNVP